MLHSDVVNQSHTQHKASESNCSQGMVNSFTERDSVSCDRAQGSANTSLKGSPLTDLLPSDLKITRFPGAASSWHRHRVPQRKLLAVPMFPLVGPLALSKLFLAAALSASVFLFLPFSRESSYK